VDLGSLLCRWSLRKIVRRREGRLAAADLGRAVALTAGRSCRTISCRAVTSPLKPLPPTRPEGKMRDIWSEGGLLARVIDGYELRPQQVEFSSLVRETVEGGGLLLVEAPTGVGKSLAYLIPAVLWALEEGTRVVVSTNTKNLQDQLYTNDLPIAASVAGRRLRTAVLKGRTNYACLRKWGLLERGQIEIPMEGTPSDGVGLLRRWLEATKTGDLSELDVGEDAGAARLVEHLRVEEGACDPARCSVGDECFLRRLKKRAWEAQVLCVNHALLLGDLLGRWDVLPPFDALIADECHNLPKVATDQLGLRLSAGAFNKGLTRLMGVVGPIAGGRARKGKRRTSGGLGERARELGKSSDALFKGLRELMRAGRRGPAIRYRPGGEFSDRIRELGAPVMTSCCRLVDSLRAVLAGSAASEPQMLEELEGEVALWTHTSRELEHLISPIEDNGVYWIDGAASLRWNPIDAADRLGPALDGACGATVLTSATLTVGGDFGHITSLLGLTGDRSCYPRCIALESPFDMENAVLCIVPQEVPDPRDPSFPEHVASAVRSLVEKTGRKTLVLFTSHAMLRTVRAALEDPPLEAELLAQGVDGERAEITRRFKAAGRGVLLGTASFWEGVDFPGDEAEVLIIAKLPFPVPTEPIVEARSEALYAQGVDPFMSYQLPEAVIKLRQGFGRLIRNQEDRGVVVVLDRRVTTARYARAFIDSLPVGVGLVPDLGSAAAEAAAWFQGVKDHVGED